jgi:hypothetical protein
VAAWAAGPPMASTPAAQTAATAEVRSLRNRVLLFRVAEGASVAS